MAPKRPARDATTSKAHNKKSAPKPARSQSLGRVRLYTLDVFLLDGPITEAFARKNPVVSRTIQLRGDQTLQDLHQAIFEAFDRFEEHMYEFQLGTAPLDPDGPRYVLPEAYSISVADGSPVAGRVDQTTLDSLGLKVGRRFAYWFDFGDDWWHQINVEAVEDEVPRGLYPKIIKRVGQSPPQYEDPDNEPEEDPSSPVLGEGEAADAACLVGEVHLNNEEFHQAVEAFTRAIDSNPTVDAFEGRARAYHALAAQDEQAARELP